MCVLFVIFFETFKCYIWSLDLQLWCVSAYFWWVFLCSLCTWSILLLLMCSWLRLYRTTAIPFGHLSFLRSARNQVRGDIIRRSTHICPIQNCNIMYMICFICFCNHQLLSGCCLFVLCFGQVMMLGWYATDPELLWMNAILRTHEIDLRDPRVCVSCQLLCWYKLH